MQTQTTIYKSNLDYSIYNQVENTYFGMLIYIMLNFITNKPIKPILPKQPRKPRKPSKRISAKQVQDNLNAFITEQRQVNKAILEFIAEQRQFNKNQEQFNKNQEQFNKNQEQFNKNQEQFNKAIMSRIDNLVAKNNLTE